ncbi:MAG: radical SAM/SPASM domain-containing protein [Armatimonadota bacterium]
MGDPSRKDTVSQADAYAEFMARADAACVPLTVVWEVTNACNLRCVHCYQDTGDTRDELTHDEGIALLDELADAGVLYLVLTGGEPLLRRDFMTLAREARRREFALRIFTNGTLIGHEEAGQIAELLPLSVDISIYGARPETHESVTGVPGSHQKAVRAVSLLKAAGVRTTVKMVVMKGNVREFDDVRAWAEDAADRFVYDVQVIPAKDGGRRPIRQRLDEDELAAFFAGKVGTESETLCDLPEDGVPCGAGRTGAAVGADGTVFPCVAFPLQAGNVRQRSFGDIWRDAPMLRRLRRITLKDLRECRECAMMHLCRRCPGAAQLEHNDHRGPSEAACTVARAKLQAGKRQPRAPARERTEA